ncbi:hypothetical protein ACP70R_023082 [Stipagrostis hirtigluma subsp. patula]
MNIFSRSYPSLWSSNHHGGPRPTPSPRLPPRGLLRCTLPSAATSSAPSPPPRLPQPTRSALPPPPRSPPSRPRSRPPCRSSSPSPFLRGDGVGDGGVDGEGFECRCAVVLSATVAALLAFTQRNLTMFCCRLHLDRVQEACGLLLSLTGILGFRTMHQVDAKSQMVLVTRTGKPTADEVQGTGPTAMHSDVAALKNARSSVPVEVMNSVTY